MTFSRIRSAFAFISLSPLIFSVAGAADSALSQRFATDLQPLLKQYCYDCHNAEKHKGDLDLSRFTTVESMFPEPVVWEGVIEQLHLGEMPPKDHPQPTAAERDRLSEGVSATLDEAARKYAGDPGPVVLRRLNNAEHTYTLRDLTGVDSLDPAREFPADSAAGEGFMNTGNALVMSPALLTKYLDAAKEVASHAVLLPDGLRFSPQNSERDWTDENLARLRAFYREFVVESEDGGRLPVEAYLAATLAERGDLRSGTTTPAQVAQKRGLNARYLTTLWQTLNAPPSGSLLLDSLRQRWAQAQPADAPALAAQVAEWQRALWKFNSIGHIRRHLGGTDGPASWMEAVSPSAAQTEVRLKLTPATNSQDLVLYLAAGTAGDGPKDDIVVWKNPHLVIPGRPALPLRDVRRFTQELSARREQVFRSAAPCLAAAAEASQSPGFNLAALAQKHAVNAEVLGAWLDYLGIGTNSQVQVNLLTGQIPKSGNYDFIQGWGSDETPLLIANASTNAVRVPGNMKGSAVAVHPSPTLNIGVGWRSPQSGPVRVEAIVTHAHPECGNGVTWSLELRRGAVRQRLATGVSQGGKPMVVPPVDGLAVQPGDLISLLVGPRDGNHSCDLTDVQFKIRGTQEWDLSADVSPHVLTGNPHADRFGNPAVWSFYTEPVSGGTGTVIPAGSLLARWQGAAESSARDPLAAGVQTLLTQGPTASTPAPDVELYRQLSALGGPLFAGIRLSDSPAPAASGDWGLDATRFGQGPKGIPVGATDLLVRAPDVTEVRLPADLVTGCEFVTTGILHPAAGANGSVQLVVQTTRPDLAQLRAGTPVVTLPDSAARGRAEQSFEDFRQLFPAALCYTRIVPVDEAVTLTLYYREDQALQRLLLTEDQVRQLNRLWDELLFVSREPVLLQSAFEQIYEYATQDRPDMVKSFGPMREPVKQRADAFRQRERASEPAQIDAVLKFADQAFRRPLTPEESQELRALYQKLRQEEISHDEALRLTLARVLVAPAFLYRLEQPGPGVKPTPVNDWELATRLSYFLWSSAPDAELRRLAAAGQLRDPNVLAAQARRMMRDPRIRRLAEEFGAAWLHLHGFTTLDEKSERHFPTFAGLRESMYEESIRTFTDLFQNNRPVTSLLDADHTFVNEALAAHYGIPGVTGPEWRRVDGVRAYGRGGVLGQAAILSKQSGASRTSPILRGNWLCETLLGEKLPRPPKGVPVLPEEPPAGLSERQLTERHSSDPKCAGCHVRVDPYGFSLEAYDAIGRFRTNDASGLPINAHAKLADGTEFVGLDGLRNYLVQQRQDAFLRQFYRKLLGYALGRSVQLSDKPLIADLQKTLAAQNYPAATAVEWIVRSPQFREVRGRDFVTQN